jgi:septal ring factor EnvC (AmiA/AmiB activator)
MGGTVIDGPTPVPLCASVLMARVLRCALGCCAEEQSGKKQLISHLEESSKNLSRLKGLLEDEKKRHKSTDSALRKTAAALKTCDEQLSERTGDVAKFKATLKAQHDQLRALSEERDALLRVQDELRTAKAQLNAAETDSRERSRNSTQLDATLQQERVRTCKTTH